MLSSVVSLPSSLYAANFTGVNSTVASPPCRVRSRPILITASATATAEARSTCSTWTEQPRTSYLNLNRNSSPSFYEILGVQAGASVQEIKSAYRRLARVCHPDVAANDQKNSSADDFMKIHAAYSTLSDPDKRANYDRSLFRRQRPLSMMSGYSSRKWETDQCW